MNKIPPASCVYSIVDVLLCKIFQLSLCIQTHHHIKSVLVVLKMGRNWSVCMHQNQYVAYNFRQTFDVFHRAMNVVVHLCCSFQLHPLVLTWQGVKLESANVLKVCNGIFLHFWYTL